ncbi:lycopene cyclase domain-containing protein [bacterium]|nr:lycopene cyclase domain-containing protein [bacterium]
MKKRRNPFKKYYYLATLILVFCVPTSVAAYALSDVVKIDELVPFIVLVTIIGSIWDVWATRHGKSDRVWLWQFHPAQTLGYRIFGLPVEEYLFYIASSVYVIYMWEGMKLMARYGTSEAYIMVFGLGAWSLGAILAPYLFRSKGDRIIN